MTLLFHRVPWPSEASHFDGSVGRKLACSPERAAERTGDLRRITARRGLGERNQKLCAVPPVLLQRALGRGARKRARGA